MVCTFVAHSPKRFLEVYVPPAGADQRGAGRAAPIREPPIPPSMCTTRRCFPDPRGLVDESCVPVAGKRFEIHDADTLASLFD